MPWFSYCLADDQDDTDAPCGYVEARDPTHALLILNDERANVYLLPEGFVPDWQHSADI